MRLNDRVAIVTGAARGIGYASVERFVAEGARVMMSDIDAGGLEIAASRLGQPYEPADASMKPDVDRLIQRTLETFGRIDILLANAGVASEADFLDLDEDEFDRVLRINVKSQFLCGQAAAREMVKQGHGGVIINMSSINAVVVNPKLVAYAVSKGGSNQLTKAMAVALAPHGIRVAAIGPGTVLTDLAKQTVMADSAASRTVLSRTPLGRCGDPSEIASVAAFLASDDASYITGQTIYPDGGRLVLNYTVPVGSD